MTWDELKIFLDRVDIRLREEYGSRLPGNEYMLSHFIKLSEEVEELAEQVLAFNSVQRASKNMSKDKTALGDEVADVLITLLLLARDLNVDIEAALNHKTRKISQRLSL